MVTLVTLSAKPRVISNPAAAELAKYLRSSTGWLDFFDPTEAEVKLLRDTLGFHHLSIEDCFDSTHSAKIEQFPNYVFITLNTLLSGKREVTTEVNFFVTPNSLVTVHSSSAPVLDTLRQHLLEGAIGLPITPDVLFQAMAGRFVDEYFPVFDALDREIDSIESMIFRREAAPAGTNTVITTKFLAIKKRLTTLRRLLVPQRDIFSRLARNEFPQIAPSTAVYFRDVYDRLFRLTEILDSVRDVLSSTLEAHLSEVSNRLNEIMKVLTIATVVLLPLSLIASIYGMNFRFMPELYQVWGYPGALGLMVVVASILIWYFKRRRWL